MLLCLSCMSSLFSFSICTNLPDTPAHPLDLFELMYSLSFFFLLPLHLVMWTFFALLSSLHIWQSFGEEHIWAMKWQHWIWLTVGTEQTDTAMEVNVFRLAILYASCNNSITSSILLLYNWIESTCLLLWAMVSFSERSPISSHTHARVLIYMHSSTFTRSHMEYNEWIWIFLPHQN